MINSNDESAISTREFINEKRKQNFCYICLDDDPHFLQLCCGATSHFCCLKMWLAKSPYCPVCRQFINPIYASDTKINQRNHASSDRHGSNSCRYLGESIAVLSCILVVSLVVYYILLGHQREDSQTGDPGSSMSNASICILFYLVAVGILISAIFRAEPWRASHI